MMMTTYDRLLIEGLNLGLKSQKSCNKESIEFDDHDNL
jgi:hypothetical protein